MAEKRLSVLIESRFNAAGTDGMSRSFLDLRKNGDQLAQSLKTTQSASAAFISGLKSGTATIDDFSRQLLEAGQKAGLSERELRKMAAATGYFSDQQILAGSSASATARKAQELAAAVKRGELSTREAGRQFREFANANLVAAEIGRAHV